MCGPHRSQPFWLNWCRRSGRVLLSLSVGMPPALAKAVLSKVAPTAEELAEAKAHLNNLNVAQLNSKRVSMNQFLKKNTDPESLHAYKTVVMQNFHVHVMRCRNTEKKWSSTRIVTTKRTLAKELRWASEEKLLEPSVIGLLTFCSFQT